MGWSSDQVERLMRMQDLHRCIDIGGPLVMSGQVDLERLLSLLADFFRP